MEQSLFTQEQLLEIWETIGNRYPSIRNAIDPAFDKKCLVRCNTIEELQAYFIHGNWCVGQGFYYQNLCFINQVEGGDEWLAMKDDYDFESVTFEYIINRGAFLPYIQDLLSASKEACLKASYKKQSLHL
jgi:hypothetical protein